MTDALVVQVNDILSVRNDTWTNSDTASFVRAYRHFRNGVEIVGADEQEYQLVADDIPSIHSVEVTASNAAGSNIATDNAYLVATSGDAAQIDGAGFVLFMTTTKSGTFNPTVTKSGNAAQWKIGDTWYTTNSPSVAVSGTTPVTLVIDNPAQVTQLQLHSQSLTATLTTAHLGRLSALTQFRCDGNTGFALTGNIGDLPATMTRLYCYSTPSTLTGNVADLPSTMTQLSCSSTSSTLTGNVADLPSTMTHLSYYGTPSTLTGNVADLPSTMEHLYCGGTSSTLTGNVADLPSTMTHLSYYGTPSTLTGNVADLPSTMTYLYCFSTSSTLTGGSTPMAAAGIREIRMDSSQSSQAQIDDVLLRLYTDRALFTWTTPILNVGGTNPDPTGVYQNASPPTTGLEYVYKLVVDPDAEGFRKWTITY